MRCSAKAKDSGKQCSFSASQKVGGKPYCGNHAKIARQQTPELTPEKQYQEALKAPGVIEADDNSDATPYEMAREVIALVESGASVRTIGWVLDGWKGNKQ
jgi:hypothetical protein